MLILNLIIIMLINLIIIKKIKISKIFKIFEILINLNITNCIYLNIHNLIIIMIRFKYSNQI